MFATTASNTLAHSSAAVRALKPHTRVALRSTAATRVQVKCTASMSAKVVVPKEITTVTPTEDRVFVKVLVVDTYPVPRAEGAKLPPPLLPGPDLQE